MKLATAELENWTGAQPRDKGALASPDSGVDRILGLTYWPVQAAQLNSRESAFTLGKQSRTTAIYDGVRQWKLPEGDPLRRAARGLVSPVGGPPAPDLGGSEPCQSSTSLVGSARDAPGTHVLHFRVLFLLGIRNTFPSCWACAEVLL